MRPFYQVQLNDGRCLNTYLFPAQWHALGHLPSEAILGSSSDETFPPVQWQDNSTFLACLHRVIQKAGPDDRGLQADAQGQKNGQLFIIDLRNHEGSRGLVAPIYVVGGFKVAGGRIVRDSYRPNPIYRVCTADGITQLSESLHRALIEEMCRANPEAASMTDDEVSLESAGSGPDAKSLLTWCGHCGARAMQVDGRCPQCQNLSAGGRYFSEEEMRVRWPGGSFLDQPWFEPRDPLAKLPWKGFSFDLPTRLVVLVAWGMMLWLLRVTFVLTYPPHADDWIFFSVCMVVFGIPALFLPVMLLARTQLERTRLGSSLLWWRREVLLEEIASADIHPVVPTKTSVLRVRTKQNRSLRFYAPDRVAEDLFEWLAQGQFRKPN